MKFHGLKNEIVHEAKVTREPAMWTDITGREPSLFQPIIYLTAFWTWRRPASAIGEGGSIMRECATIRSLIL